MRFTSHVFTLLAALVAPSTSVLYGDEIFGGVEGGRFWAFYSGGVKVIDPETCQVETTISTDSEGNDLPAGWSDGVYMQSGGGDDLKGCILINSRINRANSAGDTVSDVYVFNTESREVSSIVEVGPSVVHSYGVYTHGEFWTHSDGDGHFYVIDLDDISKDDSKVQAHQELPFHGKLLWDEDGTLGNRGFATSTGEPYLFELDIAQAALTTSYDFSNDVIQGTCFGLHAIAYSAVNQHVYAECIGGGGIVEFDVSGGGIRFVSQHVSATGALYEVPDGTYVVASNKGGDTLHLFKPGSPGQVSSIQFDVSVPGHPSTPSFYPYDTLKGGADFIACMPLTGNMNMNQHDSDGNVACDYFNSCTGAVSAVDVSNGVCYHENRTDGSAAQLVRVTEVVTDNNELCSYCADAFNFDSNGVCICTPNCGSCDTEPSIDPSKSGVSCVDLGDVVDGIAVQATLIPDAGAVKQGSPYPSSNECGFGRTYRTHKRGAIYDASVANFPENSIVIVRMDTQEKHCSVPIPETPSRVVYAPRVPVEAAEASSNNDGDSGALSINRSAVLVAASMMILVFVSF